MLVLITPSNENSPCHIIYIYIYITKFKENKIKIQIGVQLCIMCPIKFLIMVPSELLSVKKKKKKKIQI